MTETNEKNNEQMIQPVDTTQDINPPLEHDINPNEPATPSVPKSTSGLLWLEHDAMDELHSKWTSIQAQFVDHPCTSVEQADALITDAVERIEKLFVEKQNVLRDRWMQRENASTEDLRITMQEYRSLLNSILDH